LRKLDNDVMEQTCTSEQPFLGDLPNAHQARTAEKIHYSAFKQGPIILSVKDENLIRLE